MSLDRLKIGFIPLVDAAIPIIAADVGFAAEEGFAPFRLQWSDVSDPKAGKGTASRLRAEKWGLACELQPVPAADEAKVSAKELAAAAAAEGLRGKIKAYLKRAGSATQRAVRENVTGNNTAIRDALVALADDPGSGVKAIFLRGYTEYTLQGR